MMRLFVRGSSTIFPEEESTGCKAVAIPPDEDEPAAAPAAGEELALGALELEGLEELLLEELEDEEEDEELEDAPLIEIVELIFDKEVLAYFKR